MNEIQHADVVIRIAFPVEEDAPDSLREKDAKEAVRRAIQTADREGVSVHGFGDQPVELRGVNVAVLADTETPKERDERLMGEAEAAAEAEMQRRFERWLDNGGPHR